MPDRKTILRPKWLAEKLALAGSGNDLKLGWTDQVWLLDLLEAAMYELHECARHHRDDTKLEDGILERYHVGPIDPEPKILT